MANIKAKEKNISQIAKRTKRNSAIKSKVRTAIKKAKLSAVENSKDLNSNVAKAHKAINESVSKNVFHKNNGARKMARLDSFVKKQITKE